MHFHKISDLQLFFWSLFQSICIEIQHSFELNGKRYYPDSELRYKYVTTSIGRWQVIMTIR